MRSPATAVAGAFLVAWGASAHAAESIDVPLGPGTGPPADTAERLTLDEAGRRALARNPTVAVPVGIWPAPCSSPRPPAPGRARAREWSASRPAASMRNL